MTAEASHGQVVRTWLLQGVARPDPGHTDVAILIDDMLRAREVFTSLVLASFYIEPLISGDAAEQHRVAVR